MTAAPLRAPRRRWLFGGMVPLLVLAWLGLGRAGTGLVVTAPLDKPDAIVLLGSHEWERMPEVARQARRVPTARVVLTYPERLNPWNCYRCADRPALLASLGIAPSRIVVAPRRVRRTEDEAESVRDWARASGLHSILIVTSPYHTRRALATFRHVLAPAGIRVGVQPSRTESPARPERWWAASYDRRYVRYEWAAIVYYRLRFGIRS